MYANILFPTDGSDASYEALDHALDIADTYDATVHALYVIDTSYPCGDFDGGGIDLEPVFEAFGEEGERTIDELRKRANRTGVDFVGAIRESSVIHRAILAYATENGIDMIVMGTHGRRGLDRWVLGSVTERIVRTADIPVLTVRKSETSEE